jgi:ATP-binding cassette, subfamily B (MDR/TAP), member 1
VLQLKFAILYFYFHLTLIFHKLFLFRSKFASTADVILACVGSVSAIAAGATQPLLMVLFGDLTDAASLELNIMETITPLALMMLYVACGAALLYSVAYWALPRSSSNIASAIRTAYFKSVLRLELAEFDKKASGAVVIDINEKVHDIEKGLSLKLAEAFTAASQFALGKLPAFLFFSLLFSSFLFFSL